MQQQWLGLLELSAIDGEAVFGGC